MAIEIKMTDANYMTFMSVMNLFKMSFASEVSIVDGKILQFTPDRGTLYDIDLTPIFGENTIYLNGFLLCMPLLEIFERQNSTVSFILDKDFYTIKDKDSSIKLRVADPKMFACKPIKKDSNYFMETTNIDSDRIILSKDYSHHMTERIKNFSRSLESKKIVMKMEDSICKFIMLYSENNKDMRVELFETESDDSYTGFVEYNLNPFLLKSKDINVSLYPTKSSEDKVILHTTGQIGENPCINVNTWSFKKFSYK